MAALSELLFSHVYFLMFFFIYYGLLFCFLLAKSTLSFEKNPSWRNKHAIAGFVAVVFVAYTYVLVLLNGMCFHENKIISWQIAQLETCPYDYLEDGLLNCNQIIVNENVLYPEDKVVSFKISRSIFIRGIKYEVENHNGKSKVVAIFLDGEEIY